MSNRNVHSNEHFYLIVLQCVLFTFLYFGSKIQFVFIFTQHIHQLSLLSKQFSVRILLGFDRSVLLKH